MSADTTGMRDVTAILDHYRESLRQIWNNAFWPDRDFRNGDAVDFLDQISRILFDALVLYKLDREWPPAKLFREPIPFLRIQLTERAEVMLNREPSVDHGQWQAAAALPAGNSEIHFIQFFDWMQMDYMDLQYYKVNIASFEDHSELTNRRALVERRNVRVFLVPESA